MLTGSQLHKQNFTHMHTPHVHDSDMHTPCNGHTQQANVCSYEVAWFFGFWEFLKYGNWRKILEKFWSAKKVNSVYLTCLPAISLLHSLQKKCYVVNFAFSQFCKACF